MKPQNLGIQSGLTTKEVEQRIQKGERNISTRSIGKSKREIIQENVCTLFNLLNALIAGALIIANAWTNIVFILIIILNITIGVVQELHAKKLVDQLTLFMKPTVVV